MMPDKKINILLVEDERIIAIDIKRTIEKLGYNVIAIVGTGEEAIIAADKKKPDLILMDIMLDSKMTGIEASEEITKKNFIPIVYLTALSDNETISRAKITEPFGYVLKPFDERNLHSAIEMALYKYKVEVELKKKTKELEEEKIKTDKLLHNILPAEIIEEWKQYGVISPRKYNMISILFTDFQGFTDMSSRLSPDILVQELNDIFTNFDEIIDDFNLEKLKTIGDMYMIGAGLPKESSDHAIQITLAAMKMHEYLQKRNSRSDVQWLMRAGINSGEVIAGIVGMNKFTYDVWGDTVNIASRMESCSTPGKINISGSTYNLIKEYFHCEYRGKLNAKGKGEVDMYFVNSLKSISEPVSLS